MKPTLLLVSWYAHTYNRVAGCAVCVIFILGALPIPKGAVPVLARGLGHTAPTYAVGSRIDIPRTAGAARSLLPV